jgi:hypothetical protein
VSASRDVLELALSPELLAALDEHIREIVAEALREERARAARAPSRREWLTLAEAANEFGCTPNAMRMRVTRGTIESKRQGRRVYVRVGGASRNGGVVP